MTDTPIQAPSSELDDLRPRRYQEEVFDQARQRNVIAALDTGSGKTYISTLLLKWIATQVQCQGKAMIFLVPKVALVEQQGDFISKNSPLRVIKLHGALEIDLTDRVGWQKKFDEHDVFVMTAQIFLNLLTHSLWKLEKVSLMVFDECHHARKNHPYNGIMREYMQTPSSKRPKVFGMTASPIWNPKDATSSLMALEANMDAVVIGVRQNLEELAQNSPKPIETVKEYTPPPEVYDFPSPSLWDCLRVFDVLRSADLDIPWDEVERRYHVTLNNLGPYAASLYLYAEFHPRINQLVRQHDQPSTQVDEMNSLNSQKPKKPLEPELLHVNEILSDYQSFFIDESTSHLPMSIPLTWCTPKIRVLVEVLLEHLSPTFQGIIFVEQRQVATCLSRILPCIPELKDLVRCADLIGSGATNERVSKDIGVGNQREAVKMFRNREINLLIATSVAEEGLDFPACDMVVRFDPLQHMVGYVQSRGRARNKTSKFVIMIQKDDVACLAKYHKYLSAEPHLKSVYQTRQVDVTDSGEDQEDDEDEELDLVDLSERERYVVPSTSAFISYDNSLSLINQLCSMIPRDAFTSQHVPRFTGDFQSTLQLPACLPLPPKDLIFTGPRKHSKKEAKRAVAFMAVKHLHKFQVFDDYLLPAGSRKKGHEDGDGRAISDVSQVPDMMDILVRDPWTMGSRLWSHTIYVDGLPLAGLVTGTLLPALRFGNAGSVVEMGSGALVIFDGEDEHVKRRQMDDFTRLGVWYRITARLFVGHSSLFLVPITSNNRPDFPAIERLLANPHGNHDWTGIHASNQDRLLVMNSNQNGRTLLLRQIRSDLTLASVPPQGSLQDGFQTYYDYFVHKWTRKSRAADVPTDGPLLEVSILERSREASYHLEPASTKSEKSLPSVSSRSTYLVPQGCCTWIELSHEVSQAYQVLPVLCHRITDIYRAHQARFELRLPSISDSLLIQALTIPSSCAGYSNQRLETLGDAVLELCTTVHLYNRYPHRHEGQLDNLRQSSISNRYLCSRALDVGLEQFVTSENQSLRTWRYILPENSSYEDSLKRLIPRRYPRRSLQDCMEAVIGASFVTGGIPMALHTGSALGLTFGGSCPWPQRYESTRASRTRPASSLFSALQESLGYTFQDSDLLVEAVTHPSFAASSNSPSYQRLEFLGDAILDLVVIDYLYRKYPEATSETLARPRAKAVCTPALASIAVRRLGLHQIILINNVDLSMAIDEYVPLLQNIGGEEMAKTGWRYDPPKALSDVFESVMGAVLIDTGYDYEKTARVVEYVMEDILVAVSPSIRRDPVSELIEWTARSGCRNKIDFKKSHSKDDRTAVEVRVHDIVVAGPIVSTSYSVAKGLAAERALSILKESGDERCLAKLCNCREVMDVVKPDQQSIDTEEEEDVHAMLVTLSIADLETG